MKITKSHNKQILTVVLLAVFLLLNKQKASAQGPNAPEAASFEPVDATDMVNLVTGGLSYVLPLLNVPSPEGGYPISLSYHAGIAMDQEASWVGLGWSLNPGSINRGVNGYPDDWGETNVDEFFYDKGYVENFYRISAGLTINDAVSVGLGVSWGTGQSLGGYVYASIGIGESGRIGVEVGTNGVGINGGIKGFSASISTNGIGIGYSVQKGSTKGVGFDLNYNPNSGLSGGVSYLKKTGTTRNGKISKYSGMGISFSSNGLSMNGKKDGIGAGVSVSNQSLSVNDYDINVSNRGFTLPIAVFYIGFNHTRVKRSLYKFNDLYVSGMAYPYFTNQVMFPEESFPTMLNPNHFMDVNTISRFDGSNFLDELLDITDQFEENNLELPNYDNYTLTAQGLSGAIKPISYEELNLSARGRFEEDNDESHGGYLNLNNKKFDGSSENTHQTMELEKSNLHFYFGSTYNSFLRNERSDIQLLQGYNGLSSSLIDNRYAFTRYIGTLNTSNFNNTQGIDALSKKKRTGNSIKTYTNKQIRESYENTSPLAGFIDAIEYKVVNSVSTEDFLDRSDTKVFDDKGIGAYTVTAMDGKVYHYSLPVYNFESFYKNYHDTAKKDLNFVEISKMKPYATHWLLTAVTGPDYVDVNNNGKLDKEDYGYWVSFDYGKWSDGYLWETPVEESMSNEKSDVLNYSVGWGRKQLYYLDAIKTRTHTALFVKELREDNISPLKVSKGSTYWNPHEDFILETHAKEYVKDQTELITNIKLYRSDGSLYDVNDYSLDNSYCDNYYIRGKRTKYDYINIPKTKGLKLKKILILKNKELENKDLRNSGTSLVDKKIGYLGIINGYSNFSTSSSNWICNRTRSVPTVDLIGLDNTVLFDSKKLSSSFEINEFESHFSENVIDVNDIGNLNLEGKSQQEIVLVNDYSLALNSPNSEATGNGRSTLKEVHFKGKAGVQVVPPYKFLYNTSYTYDKRYENDWGYRNDYPQAWSLNKITTPTGGNINISYEKDEFETAINNYIIFKNESDRFEAKGPIIDHVYFADPTTFNRSGQITVSFRPEEISNATLKGESESLEISIGDKLQVEYVGYLINKSVLTGISNYNVYQYEYKGTAEVISEDLNSNTYEVIFDGEIEYIDEIHGDQSQISDFFPKKFEENKTVTNEYTFSSLNSPNLFRTFYRNELWYTLKIVKEVDHIRNSGGYRTKDIAIDDGSGNIIKTVYDYDNIETGNTSGITSYAPFSIQANVVPYVSELPPPSVMYKNVTMRNYDDKNNLLGSTVYEFETLEPMSQGSEYLFSLGAAFMVKENQSESFEGGAIKANKFTFYNKLANIGRLLSTKSYNNENHLLNENRNHYKSNLDNDIEIGVSQESYKSLKAIYNNDDNSEIYLISSTSKINYPSVLESVTTNQGNFEVTKYFDKYDFLTGQVLETRTYASDGVAFKTKIVPAYERYSEMGSKVDDPDNANMLTQEAVNYSYLYKNNDWQPIGVNITTWNNNWNYRKHNGDIVYHSSDQTDKEKIWRKHKSYVWKGAINTDGTYASYNEDNGSDDDFVWGIGQSQTNSEWQEVSEVTKYDRYSMTLETKDINGNYASTKMGDNNSKVIAVSNAKYTEMYYSGAEYEIFGEEGVSTGYFDGEIRSTGRNDDKSHTGEYSVKVTSGEQGFYINMHDGIHQQGKFKVSVWVHKDNLINARIYDGSSVTDFNGEKSYAGDWVLVNHYVDITSNKIIYLTSNSGYVYYDDFRLHPITSSMTSYVYNEFDEVTFITGANGLSTCYVYDSAGRLKETWVEVLDNPAAGIIGGFKRVSKNSYNYKKQ